MIFSVENRIFFILSPHWVSDSTLGRKKEFLFCYSPPPLPRRKLFNIFIFNALSHYHNNNNGTSNNNASSSNNDTSNNSVSYNNNDNNNR
jgi:hypothetical protein